MKLIIIAFINLNLSYTYAQSLNLKLKNSTNPDTIVSSNFNFYKVSNNNIDLFVKDTNTLVILYSTWCNGLNERKLFIDSFLKVNSSLKIFLITSDLNTTIEENILYLKRKQLFYDVLYLDNNVYSKGNWGIKYANFINSICTACKAIGLNTTRFVLYKNSKKEYKYEALNRW